MFDNTKKISEEGAVRKNWGGRAPIALVYPNSYFVGMSNLAIHLLYKKFNDNSGIVAERFFSREKGGLHSMESGRALSDFNSAAFTFSFERDYLNIPRLFGNIKINREKRSQKDPIMIAGGAAVTLNPGGLGGVFDAIFIGEADDAIDEITIVSKEGYTKEEKLGELSKITGFFVPGFNKIEGVTKVCVADLNRHPTHSVIWTDETEFGHMHLVEVSRGCPWKCRFCAVPPLYTPYRARNSETILNSINFGLTHRNHIGFVGADVFANPDIIPISKQLSERGIGISFSSLRANRISLEVALLLKKSGHRRTTLGIEAGSERLRNEVNKSLTDAAIFRAVKNLALNGITNLRLYFMLGLPTEREEDIKAIARLAKEIRKIIISTRSEKTLSPNITVVVTPFIPKKDTPYAETAFAGKHYIKGSLGLLKSFLKTVPNTKIIGESPKDAEIEYRLSHITAGELLSLIDLRP